MASEKIKLPEIEKEGWLVKQAGGMRAKKKRWCVLAGGSFYYFKTSTKDRPVGVIDQQDLLGIEKEDRDPESHYWRYNFLLKKEEIEIRFFCLTEQERDEWYEAVENSLFSGMVKPAKVES